MNRLNQSNLSMFFLGIIYAVAVDVKNAPGFERSSLSARSSEGQWITMTRIPGEGDATSKLFSECLKSSRTTDFKLSSVVSPATEITYWRHELATFEHSTTLPWDDQLDVVDIFDCADAAAEYRLFKKEGNTCFLSNKTFVTHSTEYQYGAPEGSKDVVYINNDMPPSPCLGNGVYIDGVNGPCVNVVKFLKPIDPSNDVIDTFCDTIYSVETFYDTANLSFTDLQNYLRTNKITGEYVVNLDYDIRSRSAAWESDRLVESSLLVSSTFENYDNLAYIAISSDHDYKLVGKAFDDGLQGIICGAPPRPPQIIQIIIP